MKLARLLPRGTVARWPRCLRSRISRGWSSEVRTPAHYRFRVMGAASGGRDRPTKRLSFRLKGGVRSGRGQAPGLDEPQVPIASDGKPCSRPHP
jgi:hypothetical protein